MHPQSVIVFVTDQSDCLRLIRHGKTIADERGVQLQVITIQINCELTPFATEQLQKLYNCTQKLGGEMNILFSQEPALTAAVTAKKLGVTHIVSGVPERTFINNVRLLLPEIPWTVVESDGKTNLYSPLSAAVATPL